MKISLWLFVLALAIACFVAWATSNLIILSWHQPRFEGVPLPSFTQLVLFPHDWILLYPVPWIVAAFWLTLRKQISPGAAFVFAGTVCVGLVVIISAVTLAALLPHLDLITVF